MNCNNFWHRIRFAANSTVAVALLASHAFGQDIQTFQVSGSLETSRFQLSVEPFDSLNGTRQLSGVGLEFDGYIDMEILIENFNSIDLEPTDWYYDAGANMILAFDSKPGYENGGPFYGLGGVFESAITGELSAGSGGDPPPFGDPSAGDVTVTADFSRDFLSAFESDSTLAYFLSDTPLQASISPFLDLVATPVEDGDGFIGANTTMLDFEGTLKLTYNFVETLGRPEDCNGDGTVDINDLSCVCTESAASIDNVLSAANLLKGDLDGDGAVAFADFLNLSANFGQAGNYLQGDLDCSGEVAFADFLIMSSNFGQSAQASQSVPEPAVHIIWLLMLAAIRLRRPSRRSSP